MNAKYRKKNSLVLWIRKTTCDVFRFANSWLDNLSNPQPKCLNRWVVFSAPLNCKPENGVQSFAKNKKQRSVAWIHLNDFHSNTEAFFFVIKIVLIRKRFRAECTRQKVLCKHSRTARILPRFLQRCLTLIRERWFNS